MDLPLRLAGAVWGHLVGDAVGVPYEFREPQAIDEVRFGARGSHGQPPGTWSDDGALMLALLDSLLAVGFDLSDQAAAFLAWRDRGAYTPDSDGYFDIGGVVTNALQRLGRGIPPDVSGLRGERDNGNGSLMRILPLALVDVEADDAVLIERAHRASAVTHGHPLSQMACALYVLAARDLLLAGETGVERQDAVNVAKERLHRHYVDAGMREHLEALDRLEGWRTRRGTGYVLDSFWSAWDAFAWSTGYRDAIETAVRFGHDTDTTACIAGGLAGAWFGLDAIPPDWLAGMRGHDLVEPLVDRLVEHAGWLTSRSNPLRVDWVDPAAIPAASGWLGRLGMTFLPGLHAAGAVAAHWRDPHEDAVWLRVHWGIETLLLLVEDAELRAYRAETLPADLDAADIELLRVPVSDGGVPPDREAFHAALETVAGRLREGGCVAVACLGGRGRAGTAVACLLVDAGLDADAAIAATRAARPGAIETPGQEAFVRAWAAERSATEEHGEVVRVSAAQLGPEADDDASRSI